MKITRLVALGLAVLLQAIGSTPALADSDEELAQTPLNRPLMERMADRPAKTFLPLEWRNKDWVISPWGYVRLEYESVENDDAVTSPPIGRNDGFILESARLGIDLNYRDQLTLLASVEGASDNQESFNSPDGELEVRLRDAFVRWDPSPYIGIQGGQFKAPFAEEELRSTADLLFVSRAVGQEGVLPGRGYQEDSISLDRQVGVMLSPRAPIRFGDFGGMYYFMVGNGNGVNQSINDNSRLAIIGRAELLYSDFVRLGGAGYTNDRTVDDQPNQSREDDTGIAADLMINPDPIQIFFQYAQVETSFPSQGVANRVRRAWHVEAGYRFDLPWDFNVTPAYRYAFYDPWANAGSAAGSSENALAVYYHTLGLRMALTELPLSLFFNYTFTEEQNPRELTNDRIQVLAQVIF